MVKMDLHMHSTASDGTFSPAHMVRECKKRGIYYVSLTDHDTVAGVAEFLEEAKKRRIKAVSGVEFSTEHQKELHILGYGVDIQNAALLSELGRLAKSRESRVGRMVEKLQKAGCGISMELVTKYAGGNVLGRPHIAQVLVEKGCASSVNDAFLRYLTAGCPGFVPRESLSEDKVMTLIRGAGGQAVLAHPKSPGEEVLPLITRLKEKGLTGVEAFYPDHTDEECRELLMIARNLGLFVTQGSDSHGSLRSSTHVGREDRAKENIYEAAERLF